MHSLHDFWLLLHFQVHLPDLRVLNLLADSEDVTRGPSSSVYSGRAVRFFGLCFLVLSDNADVHKKHGRCLFTQVDNSHFLSPTCSL